MLHEFIVANRAELITRTSARVETRASPRAAAIELTTGIPVFLDQLVTALRLASKNGAIDHDALIGSAVRHGGDLLHRGLTIGQVVHDYGDVCQAITELAVETAAPISGAEFRTLNLCLDDAIAGAVTEFSRLRERSVADDATERLGVLTHELRNRLNTAVLAFESIRDGRVAAGGSTGTVLGRSLLGIRSLLDRSLVDVRLDAGIAHFELISVADLVAEVEIGASLLAHARGVRFILNGVEPTVTVEGDRHTLLGALSNLLQNAFKFTKKDTQVSLTTRTTADRVFFDIEDACGGLPPGKIDDLFRPFEQRGTDRSGVGLGLSISMKAAKANGGEISARDLAGKGCVFTLELPRAAPPPLALLEGGKSGAGSLPTSGTGSAGALGGRAGL